MTAELKRCHEPLSSGLHAKHEFTVRNGLCTGVLFTLNCPLANDNVTDGWYYTTSPFCYFLSAGDTAANHLNKHEKNDTSASFRLSPATGVFHFWVRLQLES